MPPKTPTIVVLDGYALNPGDLSWERLEALGDCEVYDRTPADSTVARAAGASAILTNKTRLGKVEFEALPELRYVGVLATGHDVVDTAAARAHGVVVTNVPAYGTESVAQFTIALLLELASHVGYHANAVRAGRWSEAGEFAHWERPLTEVAGRTLGVVGFGRIGQRVAAVAAALGMSVLATSRGGFDSDVAERVTLQELLNRSDVVSLHCPATEQTIGMIDADAIAIMRNGAWLLNTARGTLVDETALAEALDRGKLGGAALDVLTAEPPPKDHPLLSLPNCLITSHMAWATVDARSRLLGVAVDNLEAFLAGRPSNVVT